MFKEESESAFPQILPSRRHLEPHKVTNSLLSTKLKGYYNLRFIKRDSLERTNLQ